MVGRENKRTNNRTMFPTLKNNAAAGYQGPVKIELLKGADQLQLCFILFYFIFFIIIIFPFEAKNCAAAIRLPKKK